ncbi:MAG: LytTR family DNA-binding domain-containing protein [bacterium]|nr:LytTR family DNA-binding domain-containing protein [bacterium]
MEQFKVVVVDDEAPAREVIKLFLKDHSEYVVVGEAENGFEGLKVIQANKPDLIFLDIQMPKLTGFELLELLDNPPTVIFSTAYDEYALKAFEFHAIDYLLKPYNRSRFAESIQKVSAVLKVEAKPSPTNGTALLESYQQEPTHQIVVKDGTNITIIPTDELIRLAAQDDYVEIISSKGKHLKKQTMSHYEKTLDPNQFIRIHRSSIVKASMIEKIEKYGKETHMVYLTNGDEVVASASGYTKLKSVLGI